LKETPKGMNQRERQKVIPVKESTGELPRASLDIKNEFSKLKKGPQGGTIDIGKMFGKMFLKQISII